MLMGIASLKDSLNTGQSLNTDRQSLSADVKNLNTDRHSLMVNGQHSILMDSLYIESLNVDGHSLIEGQP